MSHKVSPFCTVWDTINGFGSTVETPDGWPANWAMPANVLVACAAGLSLASATATGASMSSVSLGSSVRARRSHSSSAGPPKPRGWALSPPSIEAMATKPSRNRTVAWRSGLATRHPPMRHRSLLPATANWRGSTPDGKNPATPRQKIPGRLGKRLPLGAGAFGKRGMQDELDELGVVLGVGQPLDEQVGRLCRTERTEELPQDVHGLKLPLRQEQLLLAGARLVNVDGGEDAALGQAAIQVQLAVARTLKFLVDNVVGPAARLH